MVAAGASTQGTRADFLRSHPFYLPEVATRAGLPLKCLNFRKPFARRKPTILSCCKSDISPSH
jgi:hypothetical protein